MVAPRGPAPVLPGPAPHRRLGQPDRAIEVSEAFGLRPWSMDIVVYTPEEVRRLRHVNGTLLAVIEKEGKVLYEQP